MTAWWDVWVLAALDALLWAAARGADGPSGALDRLRRHVVGPAAGERRSTPLFWRLGQPVSRRAAAALRKLTSSARRRRAAERLARAGVDWTPETLDILALVSAVGTAAAVGALVHFGGLPGPWLAWSGCGGAIGYLRPGGWVRRRGAARTREVERALPDALDIIVISLRAGLSLAAAVAEYARSASGVSGEAFRAYLADLTLGRTVEEGLAEMTRRYPGDALSVVAAALAQSARLGSPLADVLEGQASHLRRVALRRAEEAARALAVRLVVVLVVCVFPQVFIIGLGPVVIRLLGPGGLLR